jgi:hypothetical protein
MPTITETVTMKWKSALEAFRTARRESTSRVLAETVVIIEAAVPAYVLASLPHGERARRVSARSLVERCAQEAAPQSDVAGLRRQLEKFPQRFDVTLSALHTLREKIHATPGWHTTPPTTDDAVLNAISNDSTDALRARIDAQLARFGANPVTLLGVAFEQAGERWPDEFGSVDLAVEGQEVADANRHVTALVEALSADPELLGALAAHYGARPDGREILRAAAATKARR